MIASASNAIASAASPCLKFILQLAAAGSLKVAEASFNQWMIAFGLTVATAVVPKMDRRRNNKLNILQGLMVLGAAYMYPDVLFMWIGLSSALSAIHKSIRRHFFSAIKRFGNVVRPFQNAALSIQLMILQPLSLFLSASFVLGCSVRLPEPQQSMGFLLGLVLVFGIVYSFYYHFCGFRESMADCWTAIILSMIGYIWSTLFGLCMTPVYFIESVAGLVCTTASSFVKALAAAGLAARNDEYYCTMTSLDGGVTMNATMKSLDGGATAPMIRTMAMIHTAMMRTRSLRQRITLYGFAATASANWSASTIVASMSQLDVVATIKLMGALVPVCCLFPKL